VKVSVIIPSLKCNNNPNLAKLLFQFDSQVSRDFEIVVVEGISPNGKARNEGAKRAKGEILIFIDDDARLGNDFVIENIVNCFKEDPKIGIVGTSKLIYKDSNSFQNRLIKELKDYQTPILNNTTDSLLAEHLCLAIPRELYLRYEGEKEDIVSGTDSELKYRIKEAGYRIVIAKNTWLHHPAPRNWLELIKVGYFKGVNLGIMRNRFPHLLFDMSNGNDLVVKKDKNLLKRVIVLFGRYLKSLITFNFIEFIYLNSYLLGNAVGSFTRLDKAGNIKSQSSKILILKLGGIGDILAVSDSILQIREQFKDSYIVLITEKIPAELFSRQSVANEIVTFDEFSRCLSIKRFFTLPVLKSFFSLARYFHSNKFDYFIELHSLYNKTSFIKPMIIGFLSKARIRIGPNTSNRGFFLNHKIKDERFVFLPFSHRHRRIFKHMGIDKTGSDFNIQITNKVSIKINSLLFDFDIKKEDFVLLVHPGGNIENRQDKLWPITNFIEIAQKLADEEKIKVVFVFGPSESSLIAQYANEFKNGLVALSNLSLMELAALIKRSNLLLSNDSGPMHMGVKLGVNTIGIFGPGDFQSYGAYSSDNFIPVRKSIDCWPCVDSRCSRKKCLDLVTKEEIKQLAKQYIRVSNKEKASCPK